jgi:hypothetical protein
MKIPDLPQPLEDVSRPKIKFSMGNTKDFFQCIGRPIFAKEHRTLLIFVKRIVGFDLRVPSLLPGLFV